MLFSTLSFLSLLAGSSFGSVRAAPLDTRGDLAPSEVKSLVTQLLQAPTAIDRANLLSFPGGLEFDFMNSANSGSGQDGPFLLADINRWPAVVGNGMAMLMVFLGPCGMVAPHTHPRASEVELVVAGGPMQTGIQTETGGPYLLDNVGYGNASFFPRGSVHFQQNLSCNFTMLLAVLNDEDPGFTLIANAYFGLGQETVAGSLGMAGFQDVPQSSIPAAINIGQEECVQRCGIDRATFNVSGMSNRQLMKQAFLSVLQDGNDS